MEDEDLELFHVVQEDLRLKSTVGWQNAVKVLNAAYQHVDRPESQAFLDDAFFKIISIMLDQQCVQQAHVTCAFDADLSNIVFLCLFCCCQCQQDRIF